MTDIPPPPPPSFPASPPPHVPAVPAATGQPGSKNWMGITSLVLGIVGLLCCWCGGFLPSAGALVLGLLGKKAAQAGEATNGNLAHVGFILGIVGVALGVIGTIVSIAFGILDGITSY